METERKDTVSRIIKGSPEAIYQAIVDPKALATWLPPGNMQARIDTFEPWEGGAYRIVLTYNNDADKAAFAKSGEGTDIAQGHFLELVPGKKVSQSVEFTSDNPQFAGTMRMTYELLPIEAGTRVTITAENVPRGITPEDHEQGMNSSLENLDAYIGQLTGNIRL